MLLLLHTITLYLIKRKLFHMCRVTKTDRLHTHTHIHKVTVTHQAFYTPFIIDGRHHAVTRFWHIGLNTALMCECLFIAVAAVFTLLPLSNVFSNIQRQQCLSRARSYLLPAEPCHGVFIVCFSSTHQLQPTLITQISNNHHIHPDLSDLRQLVF